MIGAVCVPNFTLDNGLDGDVEKLSGTWLGVYSENGSQYSQYTLQIERKSESTFAHITGSGNDNDGVFIVEGGLFNTETRRLAWGERSAKAAFSTVEARRQGGTDYYPGVISHVHSDGTYDIAYDDGDSEQHVPDKFVRLVGKDLRIADELYSHCCLRCSNPSCTRLCGDYVATTGIGGRLNLQKVPKDMTFAAFTKIYKPEAARKENNLSARKENNLWGKALERGEDIKPLREWVEKFVHVHSDDTWQYKQERHMAHEIMYYVRDVFLELAEDEGRKITQSEWLKPTVAAVEVLGGR